MLKLDDLTVFGFQPPAETVVGVDWSVEFLVTVLSQKFAFSVVPLDLVLTEKNPVGEGNVKTASGTIDGWVVAVHWFTFPMTMNSGCPFRWSEANAFDSKWLKEILLNRVLPRGIKNFLNGRTGDDIAEVGI